MGDTCLRKLLLGLCMIALSGCQDLPSGATGRHVAAQRGESPTGGTPHQGSLKVVSLNLAHGRGNALNQLLLDRDDFEANLGRVAEWLVALDADVVALQEADGPSRWSGGFDHVAALAQAAAYPWYERAGHAQSWLFDYGTALLSRLPFEAVLNHTFAPSPPTLNKGLLLGQIAWRAPGGGQPRRVDILSVHLDFSRQKTRRRQIEEVGTLLAGRANPSIILGDFNSDWFSEASTVRVLAERAGLQVYAPDARDLGTYKDGGKRLDWILISEEFEFLDYRVPAERLSDHRAVYAEIGFR
jgi:endonuclease/exonuclease/phosphatase family metal-dependent hydrolase